MQMDAVAVIFSFQTNTLFILTVFTKDPVNHSKQNISQIYRIKFTFSLKIQSLGVIVERSPNL